MEFSKDDSQHIKEDFLKNDSVQNAIEVTAQQFSLQNINEEQDSQNIYSVIKVENGEEFLYNDAILDEVKAEDIIDISNNEYLCDESIEETAKHFENTPNSKEDKDLTDLLTEYDCEVCFKTFSDLCHLKMHLRLHTEHCEETLQKEGQEPENPFSCSICEKSFRLKTSLDLHLKTHSENPFYCLVCDKSFKMIHHFEQHQRMHSRDLSCSLCSKTYKSQTTFKRHFNSLLHLNNVLTLPERNPLVEQQGGSEGKNTKSYQFKFIIKKLVQARNRCAVCYKMFNFQRDLVKHARQYHSKSNAFECCKCRSLFRNIIDLTRHSKIHTDLAKKYICKLCCKSFYKLSALKPHLKQHTDERSLSQDNISSNNENIPTKYNFTVRRVSQKIHICEFCLRSFKKRHKLVYHLRSHTGERPFSCSLCSSAFACSSGLNSHLKTHSSERAHSCPICKTSFKLPQTLKKHLSTHSSKRPYSCSLCKKSFKLKVYLNDHIRTHSSERPHSCSVCKRTFKTVTALRSHISTHSSERRFSCSMCLKTFKSKTHLQYHLGSHSEEKPYHCSMCEKSFKHKQLLQSHLRVHYTDRPFTCSICERSFSCRPYLLNHLRKIHLGSRRNNSKYKCVPCSTTFCSNDSLNRHLKTSKHSDKVANKISEKRSYSEDRPFSCSTCFQFYRTKKALKRHMFVHTDEKPYPCATCGKQFKYKDVLRRHNKEKHPEKMLNSGENHNDNK